MLATDFAPSQTDEERNRPRVNIPALSLALAQQGLPPQSQPFYQTLPEELKQLFRQSYLGFDPSRRSGNPQTGYETNLAPLQAVLGSSAYQGADQPTQGQILGLGNAMTTGQAPMLSRALQAPPQQMPPAPAPQPQPQPQPQPGPAPEPQPPSDPYAPWGGYNNYLMWMFGLGTEPGGSAGMGGHDVGGDTGGATGGGNYN